MENLKEKMGSWGIALCLLLGSAFTVHAQNIVKGAVKDSETKITIANVAVVIQGTSVGTTTNDDGVFSLDVKSEKSVKLHLSCVGYKSVDVSAKAGDDLSVKIEKETKAIDEVSITGYKTISPLEKSTVEPLSLMSTIQTITAEQIQTIGANNMYEAMKYTVAGSLTEQGRKRRLMYSCRGQSSEIAIDGISIYQFTDVTNAISSSMIDKIENIRSSNALLSGYNGLSGVIDIQTKKFDTLTTLAEASYGTFNKIHANITNGAKFGNFSYALSVTKDKTDGPEGRNAAEDMWNLYGKVNYEVKGKFSVDVQHFYMNGMREFAQMQAGDYTVPAGNLAMIWKFDPLKFNVTLAKAKIFEGKSANTEFQFYNVDAQRYWNKRAYAVVKVTDPNDPKKKIQVVTDSIPSEYTVTNEPYHVIGGGIIQTIRPVENNFLRVGITSSKYTYPTNTNPNGTFADADIRSFTGVIVDEHNFDKVSVNAGLKLLRDYYKSYSPGSSTLTVENEWQPFTVNGSVGASYLLSEKVTLNAQLSAGGIKANSQAMTQVISGNDTINQPIKDENRTNLDLGVATDLGKVGKVTLTGFYTKRINATEYTGVLYTNDLGIETEYINNIDTKTYGIELVWASPVYGKWFSANANATLMRTIETTDGVDTRYDQNPEVMLNGGIKAEKFGFTFTTNAKYVSKYIGNRFITLSSPDQKIYVGDYLNIDVALDYKLPKYPVSVFGRVVNLTDVKYCTVSPVYPDFGRQFNLGVRCIF